MSSYMRRWVGCLGVIALLAAGEAHGAAKWLKVETEDFVLLSDGSSRDVVEFAVGYEAFRHTLRVMFAPAKPPPSVVLLFRSGDTLREYLPPAKDDGSKLICFSTEVDSAALLALSLSGDRQEALATAYEFETTWALRRMGYSLPIWMAQGTGEVFESLELRRGKCILGDGPTHLGEQWARLEPLPWETFFVTSEGSPDYSGPKATGAFHAQAWALMHRILLDGEKGRTNFDMLAAELATKGGLDAVQTTLGVPAKGLRDDIWRHLRETRYREIPFPEAEVRARLKALPAPEAELHVQLGNLLVATGKMNQAVEELKKAQAPVPDLPLLVEAMARQAARDGRWELAAKLYRTAIAGGFVNPNAFLTSARKRLDDGSSGLDRAGDGGPEVAKAAVEIRQALALDPGSIEAHRLLGRAYFLLPEITPEQIVEVGHGISLAGAGAGVRYYRALLYQRLKQKEPYLADLRQLAGDRETTRQIRTFAQERLEQEDFDAARQQTEELAKDFHYEEARAIVAKARATDLSRATDQRYAELGNWLDEKEAWEKVIKLQGAKQWAELNDATTAFIERFPRSRAVAPARRLQQQAQAELNKAH